MLSSLLALHILKSGLFLILYAISELSFASVSKRVLVFRLKVHFHANETYFHDRFCKWTRFETEAEANSEVAIAVV